MQGEKSILSINLPNSIIIRTSWLYSHHGHNFVTKIINHLQNHKNLKIVNNQFGSPTRTKDLAFAILEILPNIKNLSTKVYHYSNIGQISWYDFAVEIAKSINPRAKIGQISSESLNLKAKRPKYSVLDSNKIVDDFGIELIDWKKSLRLHLKNN